MAKKDYSSTANCRKKSLTLDAAIWYFLAVIQNFCVFIPRLFQESLDMYCGTLAGKHCLRVRD